MALVRWDPLHELDSIQAEMNRVFDAFFQGRGANGNGAGRWLPPMDLLETDDDMILRLDLPGLDRDDVKVEVSGDVLTVSGERRREHEENKQGYHRVERAFGTFSRSLGLPDGVDPNAVTADFDRGVLEVRIPKPEQRKPTRIEIGGGRPAVEAAGREK